MMKRLATIVALLLLMGCGRFDEAKERAACEKANPNDQAATEKCLETATQKWAKTYAWLPRVIHKRDQMP